MTTTRWTVRLRPVTKTDLAEVVVWYRQEAPEQGQRFRDEFEQALRMIRSQPYLSPVRVAPVRCHAMRVFPYGIWYVIDDSTRTVHVLAIMHSRRDPATVANRLASELP